jgi:hypothetical protein
MGRWKDTGLGNPVITKTKRADENWPRVATIHDSGFGNRYLEWTFVI